MERLTVASAVAGSLAVGADVVDMLAQLQPPRPADRSGTVSLAVREMKQYRSSMQVLQKTLDLLEAGGLPFPERASWIQVDHLVAILTDTALAFSDLQATLDAEPPADALPVVITTAAAPDAASRPTAVVDQQAPRVRALCSRIRWLNISLTLILTILKCPADSEAQTCRKALDQRMTRLLVSNTDLSGRLRNLGDFFNAKSMASEDLRTPAYSSRPNTSPSGMGPSAEPRAWSTFSHHTLAELRIPWLIALPLTTYELYDSRPFYPHDSYDPPVVVPRAAPAVVNVSLVPDAIKSKQPRGLAGRVKRLSPRRKKKDASMMTGQDHNLVGGAR
ncbi:hypothetical protein S7711_05165 [Stachybotrys chartarum IBT 7711]|uniref:Fungal N-terminal domain-containing protein n=1 Tax=Stachybotrys chartarum (strain CBS 109288 / IBT 7711) TaxID=1280523 RepID=A0A084B4L1_STACB|nr:hypothetical protein S7711_05165 [Stachybotrys chartarum IBT 7711]KFA48336.1 hypothetical protein S40293_04442 [Stachybotrys chartarum IBT 40293]